MKFCDKQNEGEINDEDEVAQHDIQALMERTDVSTKSFNLKDHMAINPSNRLSPLHYRRGIFSVKEQTSRCEEPLQNMD